MLRRHILPALDAALGDTPVVVVHGARQTGKTTLVRSLSGTRAPRRYVTLDDATVLGAAASDPQGFIGGLEARVAIDEVQRAPALFRAIKATVDEARTPGRFLLTGSANVLLLPKISESLAGRVEFITLWPLSQGEIEGRVDGFVDAVFGAKLPAARGKAGGGKSNGKSPGLIDRVLRGGYPEAVSRAGVDRRAAWFASYLTAILQRDVRELSRIEGLTDVPRLLALIASRTCGLLNYADLSRGLAMPQTTLSRYFSLLTMTFLVVEMPAWSSNQGTRLVKAPKVMLADTGLACHLLGMDKARFAADGAARGALVENFVAMELVKQSTWSVTKPRLFHFRTSAGREVDLVLEDASGRLVGVEVKSAGSVSPADFKGLQTLRETAGGKFHRGVVLYDGAETVPFEKDLVAMPISALWTL